MNKPENQPADALESIAFSPVDGPGIGAAQQAQEAAAQDAAQQEAQAMQVMAAGVSKIVFAGLRALRSLIARRMPEIMEEWPDDVLRAPADASAPVLQKYMERLTALAGRNPELAMLVVATVPMAMGYVSALERHARTVQEAEPKEATA